MWYEVATDNDQRRITQFLEKLDTRLGQGNQYALNLDELDYFSMMMFRIPLEVSMGLIQEQKAC